MIDGIAPATTAPVLTWGGPEILGCLQPIAFEPVKGGEHDEDHQRDLEEEIDQCQPCEGVEVKSGFIQVDAEHIEQGSYHPDAAEREDESGCERDASEV
jgi:hypothetical protein